MSGNLPCERVRALLPGLHYLAAEALRSGCLDVSRIILEAITTIEREVLKEGGHDEQRDLRETAAGSDIAH